MARRPDFEIAQASLRVPRGHQGFWKVICQLDAAGPWTQRMIDDRCNVDRASIKDYVLRLHRGGFATIVATLPSHGNGSGKHCYRLVKKPLQAPRLDRSGKELVEFQRETIWRAMKMMGTFDAEEIAMVTQTVTRQRAYKYLIGLYGVGIIARLDDRKSLRSARFRIVRNVGAFAPVLTKAEVVFDPNSRTIIGEPQLVELQP